MGKTWTKEECRVRYVQGQRIGLYELSVEACVPFGTLKRWTTEKPDTWFQQRRRFEEKTIRLTDQKSMELVSDAIAASNEDAIAQHLKTARTLRELSMTFFSAVLTKIEAIETDTPETEQNRQLLAFLTQIAGRCPLAVYSDVARLAIQLERQALYLDLADPTILERAANRQGLSLVNLEVVENRNNA
jgi:hypothetical protein